MGRRVGQSLVWSRVGGWGSHHLLTYLQRTLRRSDGNGVVSHQGVSPRPQRLVVHVRNIRTGVRNIRTNLSDLFGGTSRSLADRSRWYGWVPRYVMYPFFLYWSGAMPPTNF